MVLVSIVTLAILGSLPIGKVKLPVGEYSYSVIREGKESGFHRFIVDEVQDGYRIVSIKDIKPEEGGSFFDSTLLYINAKTGEPERAEIWTRITIGSFGPIEERHQISFKDGYIESTKLTSVDSIPKKSRLKSQETPWLIEPLSFVLSAIPFKKGKTFTFKLLFPTTNQLEDATLSVREEEGIKTAEGKVKAKVLDVSYRGRQFRYWVNRKVKPYLLKVRDISMNSEEIPK